MNLAEPSFTGAIPGACCNHPMSLEEPCNVFRTLDMVLKIREIYYLRVGRFLARHKFRPL